MLFQRPFTAVLLLAVGCLASPTPLEVSMLRADQTDSLVQEGIDLAHTSQLQRRLKADFSMAKRLDHQVLFHGDYASKQKKSAENVGLSITCLDCETKGSITAKLWEDKLHPSLRLQFNDVEAHILLGLNTTAATTISVTLFASNTPIGLHYPGLTVGVVFFVDLVFDLDARIDMTGGFTVKIAKDAFLQTDLFKGDVKDHFFDGMSTKSLPITVETGTKATFKADLRLRVQVGAEAKFKKLGKKFGIGAGAAMGIYANLVEFVAEIEDTPTCALETREYFDLNVGAYAKLDVEIDYKTTGLVPTVSTTLLSAPAHTQCWKSKKPSSAPLKTTKKATSSSPMVSTKSSASRSSQMTAVTGSQTRSLSSVATSVTSKYPNSTEFPATVSSAVPSLAISLPLGATGNGNYPVVHTSIRIVSDSQVEYSLSGLPASHPLAFSTLPAAASITPKYSPIPARAVAASLNGPGKYPTVHTSHVTIPCSQAASASSLSSLSKSFRVASPSRPAVANATGNYPSLSSTIPPRLSTVVPSLAAVVPGNGIGRYPFANASFPGNQTHLVTTTLYSTAAYTITVCGAAGVANCPVAYQSEVATTKTIDSYTTICPAGAQVTWPAAPPSVSSGAAAWRSPSSSSAAVSSAPAPVTVTHVIFLTAIPSPKPNTFVPPPVPASTVPTGGW
ncbi:uncharacterized protein PG998_005576 [Apiospora kogelbergensis]|uniref:uncharacterized protein n=1 Tax=Apiospora kogelbergensis TaxID=1337665 RepID=UPI00312DDC95